LRGLWTELQNAMRDKLGMMTLAHCVQFTKTAAQV
jgi:hypothetical protein